MSNSAFQPSILTVTQASSSGSGQGEVNVVTNPSAATDLTKWTATGFTAARATSGSPLDPVVPTGFVLTPQAIGNTFTSEALTVPSTLRNRKLKLEFYYTQASAAWKVDVLNSSDTRFTLTTDSSSVSAIPASSAGGKFVTYFDMDSGSTVKVRFTSTAASGAISVTQVIVGPGIQPQGAVVGKWQSYTPTLGGITIGNGSTSGQYRQIGDSIELLANVNFGSTTSVTGNITISMPTQFSVDSTKLLGDQKLVGYASAKSASGATFYSANSMVDIAAKNVYFLTPGTANVWNATSPATWGTNADNEIVVRATIPIAEWAGSGTVQLAQNDVEYAANGDTSGSDNSSNFVYSAEGNLFPSITAALGTPFVINKTVRFQTPIQLGDRLEIEIKPSGSNQWVSLSQVNDHYRTMFIDSASGNRWGIGLATQTGTDVIVQFGRAGRLTSGWSGAVGLNYPAAAQDRWRVRKSSAGAAVGFGIADSNSAGLVRNRTAWNSLSLSDISVSALGGGSVTVTSADIQYLKWKQIDDTVLVAFKIGGISVTGTVTTIVINLPASFPNLSSEGISTAVLYDNSSTVTSVCNLTLLIDKRIYIAKSGSGNFTASTDNTYIYGQVFGSVT